MGMILAVAGAVLTATGRASVQSLSESADAAEAQTLANSAVEHALCLINASSSTWRATYNGVTTTISLGHGSFSWNPTDVGGATLSSNYSSPFVIHASGTVRRSTYTTQVQATASGGTNLSPYGLVTSGNVTLNGGTLIDSYDSSKGSYGGTNIGSQATVATNSTSNGTVTISGGTVKGSVYVGSGANPANAITLNGSGSISGSKTALTQSMTIPTPTAPTGMGNSVGSVNYNSGTNTTLSSNLHCGSLSLSNAKLTISGNVTIYCEGSFNVNSGSTVEVLTNSSLTIYFTQGMSVNANAIVDGANLSRSKFVNLGTSSVNMNSGSSLTGAIVSPNGDVNINNSGVVYGAIVAKDLSINSSGVFHQDVHISNGTDPVILNGGSTAPVPVSWTRIVN
jgi:cytoskeletal protein CcmA (bactofilin family)